MNQEQWSSIDHYLSGKLVRPDATLDAALASSAAAGLPAINVADNQGKFLHLLAKIRGAKRILEIGTLGGYSTIWLARALPAGGRLVTLELEPDRAALARENIERAGLSGVATVVCGPAADSLEQLIEDGAEPFDFVFVDADKRSYPNYLRLTLRLTRAGSVIVGDNVVRRGQVADPATSDPDVVGVRQFFDLLASNPALDSTAVQTVGVKGWDGFSITVVMG